MSETGPIPRPNLSALQRVEAPSSLRVFAAILLSLFLFALIALAVVPWQQNVSGTGRVVAFDPFDRIQTLAAPVSGRVDQAWVIEGSRVEKGDRILQIVDNDPAILERLQQQADALRAQLEASQQKAAIFDLQISALEDAQRLAVESARSEVEVARAEVRSEEHALEAAVAAEEQARLNFDRQRELVSEGLASDLEFEIAEREAKQAQARVAQARRALDAARNDEEARIADLGRVDTEARARVEAARVGRQTAQVEVSDKLEKLTALEGRIAQQNTQLLVAPRAGTVFRLFASPGAELVRAGDPLVQLIPDTSSRAVEIWVDGNDLPLVSNGRPVRLQFEGWPAVQFAGWPSVAVGTFGGRVALIDPSDDGRGRFRLLVVPDENDESWPEARYLRQGVRANAWILLDQVSLGYELWRQANGFPPTVALVEPGRGVPAGAGGR